MRMPGASSTDTVAQVKSTIAAALAAHDKVGGGHGLSAAAYPVELGHLQLAAGIKT